MQVIQEEHWVPHGASADLKDQKVPDEFGHRKKISNPQIPAQKIKNWKKEFDLVGLFIIYALTHTPHPYPITAAMATSSHHISQKKDAKASQSNHQPTKKSSNHSQPNNLCHFPPMCRITNHGNILGVAGAAAITLATMLICTAQCNTSRHLIRTR